MKFSLAVCLSISVLLGIQEANSAVPRDGDTWDYIKLKSGDIVAVDMDVQSIYDTLLSAAIDSSHVLVRFAGTPSAQDRFEMEASGTTLLSYIPYAAWVARVRNALPTQEITDYNIEWVSSISAEMKINAPIKNDEFYPWARIGSNHLLLACFHDDIDMVLAGRSL